MRRRIGERNRKIKVGLAQSTAGADGPGLLERTAEFGLAGAEPMIDSPDSEYLSWSSDKIKRFVQQARALNVSLPTLIIRKKRHI